MPYIRSESGRCAPRTALALLVVLLLPSTPAFADATVFLGSSLTPSNRTAKGIAIGAGLLIVGFEFEFFDTGESLENLAPSLRTGMGNVLFQTPFPIAGFQPYFTTGTGIYRERLEPRQETNIGFNTGGGAKISLVGPIRARLDYRVFNLRGEPLHSTVHRVYAGLNVAF
jgi:hypothetical protein